MKPIIAALLTGSIVFLWAYQGARWSGTGSTVIATVWAAQAYVLTRVFGDPEPGVRR